MEIDYKVPLDQFVVLVDNRNERRLLKISQNKNFKWRKIPIKLSDLTQHDYYTLFEVGNHQLLPVQRTAEDDGPDENSPDIGDDNREIYTLDEAQKLQPEQIEQMKKNLKPDEIIHELVEHNEQFAKRTAYSKQKYLRKKQRKYMFRIHAQPVTLDTLHAHYFKDEPRSVGCIRWDMLALMLLHAGPYRRVCLAEKTKGLLLGCALVRGATTVTSFSPELKTLKSYPIVEQLNIDKNRHADVHFRTWDTLAKTEAPAREFDNVMMLGNYDFAAILQAIHASLSYGCILALHCMSMEPLVDAYAKMHELGMVNVKLYDSWSREYQVLKNRTHPMMSMDSASGYLLTAINVQQ